MSQKSDDSERFRNLVLYKYWGTDAEFERDAPWIVGAIVLLLVLGVLFFTCN